MYRKLLTLLLVLTLPVLLLPKNAFATGIAFDTSGKNVPADAQHATVSLAAAATNEIAIVYAQYSTASGLASVKVNGSSSGLVQIGSTLNFSSTNQNLNVYYYLNPPTSSVAYAVTGNSSDSVSVWVEIFSGTAQSAAAIDSFNSYSDAASASLTESTTVIATGCWLASYYQTTGSGTNNVTAGTGTTARQINLSTAIGDSNGTVGTGSQSMGWNGARTTSSGFIVSLAPPAATVTASPQQDIISFQ